MKGDGTLIQEGDLLVNAKLGTTLRRIADDPMTYYNGTLADDIVADLLEYGSLTESIRILKNELKYVCMYICLYPDFYRGHFRNPVQCAHSI